MEQGISVGAPGHQMGGGVLRARRERATEVYETTTAGAVRGHGSVCDSIRAVIDYLKTIPPQTRKRAHRQYLTLKERSVDFPRVWVLRHHFQSARDLLEAVRGANDAVLSRDGFWIVQDERRFHREGVLRNVEKLMVQGELCLLKLDQHNFGFNDSPYMAHLGTIMPDQECHLPDFVEHTLALDKAVADAMAQVLGHSDGEAHLFCEALFNVMPTRLKTFYERDMDINRFEDLQPLGFGPADSLVDADMSRVSVRGVDVRSKDIAETYDAYDFPVGCKRGDILKLDPRVSTGIILNDDGVGECVRKKLDGGKFKSKVLRIIAGVNKGSIITSMFGSRTSIHVEDAFLGTYNYMLIGAPKIWYMVPKRHGAGFRRYLRERKLLGTVIEKTCFVRAFADQDGIGTISGEAISKFDINRFVQYPGMAVMSVPGEIYHWTVSCGFNIAESGNYFTIAGGESLANLESSWSGFVESGGPVGNRGPMEASSLYFRTCRDFEVL